MARVAYVMESVMSKLGVSEETFIPMILGFGCTVSAIMTSRALEKRHDRFIVMLIRVKRMTDNYILFTEMFFQDCAKKQ